MIARADAIRLPLADGSCDLVIGSPPYANCRTYLEDGRDLGIARECREWVGWMLRVTAEALRVSRGLVVWVVAGKTEDWTYQPGPEGLAWRWFDEGWTERGPGTAESGSSFRPCIWHRSGISGSGGEQWYRADTEYVLAFKRPGRLPFADPLANGHRPKFKAGGPRSNRNVDGSRVTGAGKWKRGRRASGAAVGDEASWSTNAVEILPEIANPGNLLSTGAAGGGHLGHPMAHENEAPYPVDIPAFWINSHSPPGGLVCGPFSGSGTDWQACEELGRRFVGFDLRKSQCDLTRRRLATVTPSLPFAS